jgi:hypothetical protein
VCKMLSVGSSATVERIVGSSVTYARVDGSLKRRGRGASYIGKWPGGWSGSTRPSGWI